MIIRVKKINTYGQDRIYPINYKPEFENLTGQKTLNAKHIQALKVFGLTFMVEVDKI